MERRQGENSKKIKNKKYCKRSNIKENKHETQKYENKIKLESKPYEFIKNIYNNS